MKRDGDTDRYSSNSSAVLPTTHSMRFFISDNKDVKRWVDNYLGVGEWVMDQSVAVMGSSSWFERRR
ncbi:uncharacterized protein N7459_008823 [Penicillium hispanicum]|uniref:uncharacterized protein n=1 Tax=Penicillium hispanicum TaxID=1080232 RepID=UPI002540B62A|nr:uncharacterized protein N7459_008823 [Penicillium hispanicum]KAJ5574396.1 hypothetical protein N7459_008823 [Penicillium hispanicum]